MAVKFVPIGNLDTTTDPSLLPSQMVGKDEVSGAMQRCTNMSLDWPGKAVTRSGSARINSSAMSETAAWSILEMGGNRYTFAGTKLYRDEAELASGFTSARWYGVVYNAYNTDTSSIFATNGTDRKRITGMDVQEWGIDAPTEALALHPIDYMTTLDWEGDYYTYFIKFTTAGTENVGNYETVYPWESIYTYVPADRLDVTTDSTYPMFYFEENTPATFQVKYTYVRKNGDVVECESNPSDATSITQESGIVATWTLGTPYNYATTASWEGTYYATYYRFAKTGQEDAAAYSLIYPWEHYYSTGTSVTTLSEYDTSRFEAVADEQVTHVRIYRTLAGGADFYFVGTYAIGLGIAYLTVPDISLGSTVETDHDRLPEGCTGVSGPTFNGYLFAIKSNRLYFCKPNQPEYWPSTYYIEVGPPEVPLTGIDFFGGVPYVTSKYELHMIQGTGYQSFFPYPIKGSKGAVGDQAVVGVAGAGLFHVSTDGLYQYAGGDDIRISDMQFRDLFLGATAGSIPGINATYVSTCWLLHYENLLWFAYPGGTSTEPNHLIVFNLLTKKAVHYDYGRSVRCAGVDRTNDRILCVDGSGYVWVLDSGTTDNGTAISWQLQTKDYTDRAAKYFPRSAKYDIEVTSGTATSSILLNGTSIQTHAITENRVTRKRLIAGNNGDRLSVRVTGSGVTTIREITVE